MVSLTRQLEELILIRCSLLPGEQLNFLDLASCSSSPDNEAVRWERLADEDAVAVDDMDGLSPAKFRLTVDSANVWFEIDYQGYDGECRSVNDCIGIGGDNMSRAVQEGWREIIRERLKGVDEAGGDFPVYQLLSLHLLPLLHEQAESKKDTGTIIIAPQEEPSHGEQIHHHVLFTSHHLISTTKRRNLQGWSSRLGISGFAKVGYPGVIYAQGLKDSVNEFVKNVKAMQWLALKVRFVEVLEDIDESGGELKGWREFEKVGEVVEEMRRLGRGKYVVEMGIGAGAKEA